MHHLRTRLWLAASLVLAWQGASLALAPVALGCHLDTGSKEAEMSCCVGEGDGHFCPMRGSKSEEDDGAPALRGGCDEENALLVALLGVVGVLARPAPRIGAADATPLMIGALQEPGSPFLAFRSPPPRR